MKIKSCGAKHKPECEPIITINKIERTFINTETMEVHDENNNFLGMGEIKDGRISGI